MNYIVTLNKELFQDIDEFNYCTLEEMELPDILAVDSETTSLFPRKGKLFSIQIGTGSNNYIIDLQNYSIGKPGYTPQDVFPYLKDKTLIFHNACFDLGWFYSEGFYPDNVRDTFLASKILYNGDPYNVTNDFGNVMKRELGVIYDKTDQKRIHIIKLTQKSSILYAFNDVDRLIELHTALEKKIDDGGFRLAYDLHCRYIRALAYMEQCGLPVSSKSWKDKMTLDEQNVVIWQGKIREYIYNTLSQFREVQMDMFDTTPRINISLTSPLQMIKVFKALGINVLDKDDKESINENVISKSKHEFVEMWLNFQEANHRVSTFGKSIYDRIENERIYTNFNPMVDTARLSTRRGEINFLNFPADKITRECFQANQGNVIVACDLDMQEGILMGDKSQDAAMIASVVDKVDLHCLLTKKIYPELADLSDEEIKTKHKDKRTQAKISRFSLSYGSNAYTLHTNQNIPMEDAVNIEKSFKELHSGLYEWGNKNYEKAIKLGYLESCDGWKLKLPKYDIFLKLKETVEQLSREDWSYYKEGKIENKRKFENPEYIIIKEKAYNFYKSKRKNVSDFFKLKSEYQRLSLNSIIQTTAAFQTKRATLLYFDWIKNNNYLDIIKIVNVIHDEMIIECPKEFGEVARENLERCMKEGSNHYLDILVSSCTANIGNSWFEAK